MSKLRSQPARENNAIDQITFVISYRKDFDDSIVAKFLDLKNRGIDGLPSSEEVQAVTITSGPIPSTTTKLNGIRMYRPRSEELAPQLGDKDEWELVASRNIVRVGCSIYTSWEEVWSTAKSFLSEANDCVDDDNDQEYEITEFAIQVDDKFVLPEGTDYDFSDVFNPDSEFFNSKIKEELGLWHIYQGWFEHEGPIRLLNNLNVSTKRDGSDQVTTISHLIRGTPQDDMDSEMFIDECARLSHNGNKKVMRSILSDAAQKRVGLTDA